MLNNDEIITINVTASEIVPLAEKCIEVETKIQEKKENKFLDNIISEYNNSKWNKFFKKSIKTREEAKKYYFDSICWISTAFSYPTTSSITFDAEKILEHFYYIKNNPNAQKNPTYTMPIDIYNCIASYSKNT